MDLRFPCYGGELKNIPNWRELLTRLRHAWLLKMSSMGLRLKPRISYYEPEEPNLDEYIFCDKCADFVYEYCSVHGPLLIVPDDRVPKKHNFPSFVPRAALTIPHIFLHLAPSIIPGAGLGVFSTLTLPRGVRFGPYKGFKTYEIKSMYCWQIYDRNNKPSHVVDAEDGNNSNWMRYVNCARHWREQNLIAFQYQGQLYYRTIKTIPRFTELMVFYGSEFANALHIDLRRYNSPPGYAQKFGVPRANKRKAVEIGNKENIRKLMTEEVIHETIDSSLKKKEKNILAKESLQNVSSNIKIDTPEAKTQINLLNKNRNVKTFVNNDCNKRFISKYNFTQHVLEHKPELSGMTLAKQRVLDSHENKKTNSPFNNTSSGISDDLDGKLVRHHKSGNLETHKRTRSVEKPFACDICHYKCNRKDSLKRHLRTHTGEKPFSFDICHRKFTQKNSLDTHIRTHTGEKPFSCDICHRKFTHKNSLEIHIRTHTGEKPFSCDICNRKFTFKGNLKPHIRTHTGEKPFSCDICHRKFTQKNSLDTHIRTHTGEKPFSCDICHRKFTHKNSFEIHIRTHTGEKPFSCDICNRKFTFKCNLITHIRTHTGEKPFSCDICHRKFTHKNSLEIHIRTHTGEKPFSCDICNRKFTFKGNLITHIRTHTGEKPFSCDICHRKFTHKNSLEIHIRTHTGEKPFACDICHYKFSHKSNLNRHLQIHKKSQITSS